MVDSGARTPSRRFVALLAAIPLVAVLLADGALLARRSTNDHAHPSAAATTTPTPTPTSTRAAQAEQHATAVRAGAIRALLAARGDAVLRHDRAAWMSTIDPRQATFRKEQSTLFANMQRVPFASWSYTFDPTTEQPATKRSKRYGVPSWSPADFALHYKLRGFDPRPTNLEQFPTFVHRSSGWYLASLSDFAKQGNTSAKDLWNFGPVTVLRTSTVLVLGHPGSEGLMQGLAAEVAADIPRVSAVWGDRWARKAVVLAPSTQQELGQVVGDFGKLDRIAAVASAEVNVGVGRPHPVGDRIGINPVNWAKLSPLGQRIVLTHELTHVATRTVTSSSTPTWLAEGFADYVGYLGTGIPTSFIAQELATDVHSGRAPHRLPRDEQFDGASKDLSQAYEAAWLACRLIADRYGQRTLVRFYLTVGRSVAGPRDAIAYASRHLLHESAPAFTKQWRGFVRSELS